MNAQVIEWLNRNAYIMIAIEGKSFCFAAWEAGSYAPLPFPSTATLSPVALSSSAVSQP
jgi:hypothetical protein